jgi:hypothetical protein
LPERTAATIGIDPGILYGKIGNMDITGQASLWLLTLDERTIPSQPHGVLA